jgi:alpha-ketoglutarate-dependent dioxygenase FTO
MVKNKDKRQQEEEEVARRPAQAKAPHSKQQVAFPLPFPPSLKYPKNAFLRNEPPYKQSFQQALDTSYEGFIVDEPNVLKDEQTSVEEALKVMEEAGFFRVDVTQPFGLGTKCAKTYVTRCLVGEPGTTYKYLGLRMFAHTWNPSGAAASPIQQALKTIGKLNATLTQRTQHHLSQLDKKRHTRGAEPTRGREGFDIALINRMESPVGLKDEPTMGEGKCSVSWHADSSLEHFSNIAVYHLVDKEADNEGKWSVGLRVAHNSEGPLASRRETGISMVPETPPLAVSLPSGSTYYLLDDFNHHHQHTVIAEGEVPGRRFSSTHRLLRESHNVAYVLARCKTACTNFHKKGPKLWRSEQLLLTEMETEWLRKFYIQGKAHYNLLWSNNWGEPMQELLKFWSQLEERTKHTIDWLQLGAEGRCGLGESSTTEGPPPPRAERKLREKRKKAREGIQELLTRGESNGGAFKDLYEPMAVLLEERATMRELWMARQEDGVFHELDFDNRPMPLPVDFLQDGKASKERGQSPLPGSPDELRELVVKLRKWGNAYESSDKRDLPAMPPPKVQQNDDHCKPLDWTGWKGRFFGLEMQNPWATHLLTGKKSIETRAYDLPPGLIGRKIEILQSLEGKAGVSALGDTTDLSSGVVEKVGWCKFDRVIEYRDQAAFEADEALHLVKGDSGYGWKAWSTEVIYGWVVGEHGLYGKQDQSSGKAIRRMRSLLELQATEGKRTAESDLQARRNRNKRRKKK